MAVTCPSVLQRCKDAGGIQIGHDQSQDVLFTCGLMRRKKKIHCTTHEKT